MNPKVLQFIDDLESTPLTVPVARRQKLEVLKDYVLNKAIAQAPINLTYICTHNSRRSHLGQVWGQVMGEYYGFTVNTFSGGTEATACNPRTIAALQRVGFSVTQNGKDNPLYSVGYDGKTKIHCFSKVYSHPDNPTDQFAAIMTCSNADKNCPVILGTEKRIPLTYVDPKAFDDTPKEEDAYDERCRQIATEMKWVFQEVKKSLDD